MFSGLPSFKELQSWKQITFSAVIIAFIVLMISGTLLRNLETSYLLVSAKAKGDDAIKLLASSSIEAIISEDIPYLETIIKGAVSVSPNIHAIRISNEEDTILAQQSRLEHLPNESILKLSQEITYHNESFGYIELVWNLTNEHAAIENKVMLTQFYLAIVLFSLSALVMYFVTRLVTRPLNTIHHQVEALMADSNHNLEPIHASQEFHVLSAAVYKLRELLQAQKFKEAELEKLVAQRTVELGFHATHDTLTGLSNRFELERRLQKAIDQAKEFSSEYCLLYMDLDQFKVVNDTCGHLAGDELLKNLAGQLLGLKRTGDTLARIGGDEFALLLPNYSFDNAPIIAEKILDVFSQYRFHWNDKVFSIGISIGVSCITHETKSPEEALSAADMACYAAKELGRNRFHLYDASDEETVRHHSEMHSVSKIQEAIEKNYFCLFQQKILPIKNELNQGIHYEILIRMNTLNGSIIPPGTFLPAAERYHLAQALDNWVIDNVVSFLSQNSLHLAMLDLCSINLSGQSLGNTMFLDKIEQKLLQSQIPLEKICFEITETAAVTNFSAAVSFISRLRKRGCRFALDDFGTGMSSFSYLKQLPVDFLKIDGFFVKDIVNNPVSETMVRSINDVAHSMNMQTIAEFVEDDLILQVLKKIGVDFVQGYGIAKPSSIDDMTDSKLDHSAFTRKNAQ